LRRNFIVKRRSRGGRAAGSQRGSCQIDPAIDAVVPPNPKIFRLPRDLSSPKVRCGIKRGTTFQRSQCAIRSTNTARTKAIGF
jgi:hypothetical protein